MTKDKANISGPTRVGTVFCVWATRQPQEYALQRKISMTTNFGEGEICEYCGGAIVEKYVILHRQNSGNSIIFEYISADVYQECRTRYYAANK